MFTIDLLKGEGIPAKSRPEGIAIGVATFAVPIAVAIVMFGVYLNNSIAMSIRKRDISKYAEKSAALSQAVKLRESLEKEKSALGSSLSEVASSIGRHAQWSPVLATIVKNMPDSMVLTKLEVKQQSVTQRVPSRTDPKKMVNVSVPKRTLRMEVSGSAHSNNDQAVKDFKDALRFSTLLGPRLEDIRVSQASDTLDGQTVVAYQIDCIFKPGL